MQMTTTPAGAISSLEALSWPCLNPAPAPGETLGWLAGQATAVLRRHPFLVGAAGLPMEAAGVVTGGGGLVGSSARIWGDVLFGGCSAVGMGSRGAFYTDSGYSWMAPSLNPVGSRCSFADS